jgi:hypothetical protein
MDSKAFEIFPAISKVLKKANIKHQTFFWAFNLPTCALFAIAPIKKHTPIIVITSSLMYGASENTVA